MSRGLLFWILMILWFLSVVFSEDVGKHAIWVSTGLLIVLFGLLGWKVFGPPLKGD